MPAEAVVWHGQAAKFGIDIGALSKSGDIRFPRLKDGLPLILINAVAERRAKVVEDNGGLGRGLGQGAKVTQLHVIVPALIGVPPLAQQTHTRLKRFVQE